MNLNLKGVLSFALILGLIVSCGQKEEDESLQNDSKAGDSGSVIPPAPTPPVSTPPTPPIPTPPTPSVVISITDAFNKVVYLVNENGNISAKNAQSENGTLTTGGVTGKLGDLTKFSIPILSVGDVTSLKITPSKDSNSFCSKPSFALDAKSITVQSFSTKNITELKTATNCAYEIIDENNNKIKEFNLLFNRTFQDYCTDTKDTSSYNTSQTMLSLMGITSGCSLTDNDLSIKEIYTHVNTNISDLSPFSGFINLSEIEIYNDSTSTFSGIKSIQIGIFDNLLSLEKLVLGQNMISELPIGVFDKLTHLRKLSISGTQISNIPQGEFDKLIHLNFLGLSNNKITTINPGLFDKLINLNTLYLQGNLINNLPNNVFDNLLNINNISLSNNKIEKFPIGIFDRNEGLITLFIDNNLILILNSKIFDNLINIYQIKLNGNKLETLPENVFNLKKIEDLDLSSNFFNPIPALFLDRCPLNLIGATCTVRP